MGNFNDTHGFPGQFDTKGKVLAALPAMFVRQAVIRWRRECKSARDKPVNSTVLRGEVAPATMRTCSIATPIASANRLLTAALALPRSDGALTRTLSVSPNQPAIPLRDDPGTTLIVKRAMVFLVMFPLKGREGMRHHIMSRQATTRHRRTPTNFTVGVSQDMLCAPLPRAT